MLKKFSMPKSALEQFVTYKILPKMIRHQVTPSGPLPRWELCTITLLWLNKLCFAAPPPTKRTTLSGSLKAFVGQLIALAADSAKISRTKKLVSFTLIPSH